MDITIAGSGYVGLVTAAVLAGQGHRITCVDVDEGRVRMLSDGGCPIYEPGLKEMLTANRERLRYTVDAASAYGSARAVFLAVGTPEKADGSANLQFVHSAVDGIVENARDECVVVVKSTVPVGTNDEIQRRVDRKTSGTRRISVVSNPEFLSQGTAVHDMLHASRIVIGTEDEAARKVMKDIYVGMDLPLVFTDRRSAEMIKYASNDFLALKISYINEIANLCELLGADVEDVARGMGMDPRIGDKFLRAGIGYGGSCFPKDTKALHWLSAYHDHELRTIKAAIEVNGQQKLRLLKKARRYYAEFSGLAVAVLGLAFKPGTDDLREAPSLDNIPILLDYGARVRAWDPVAADRFRERYPAGVKYYKTPREALVGADLCLILTEWEEVRNLKPEDFLAMRRPVILDGRNCYDPKKMSEFPLVYDSVGRKAVRNLQVNPADA